MLHQIIFVQQQWSALMVRRSSLYKTSRAATPPSGPLGRAQNADPRPLLLIQKADFASAMRVTFPAEREP